MGEKDAQTTLNMLRWHWEQAYGQLRQADLDAIPAAP
jgi:hypothetical protein